MALPTFSTLSDYLGTVFFRESDGALEIYGNSQVSNPTSHRWVLAVGNGPVTWNLVSGSITPISSTGTSYTFDFSPSVEGDYQITIEATNSDGTTSKTYTIGVGRLPNVSTNDFSVVGPMDQWVYCANSFEKVLGPAFVGDTLRSNGWDQDHPFAPGIILQLFGVGTAAPNFALNINTGPTDLGYGICPVGTYNIPVRCQNNASITPPGYATSTVTFSVIDCSGGGTVPVTKLVADSLELSDSAFANDQEILVVAAADSLASFWGDSVLNHLFGLDTGGDTQPPGPTPHPNPGATCVFEFYEMLSPEDVEVLPVPKKYDQLGPMRFDKIGKIFGFRVRLIVNGTTESMSYSIFGDDSESNPHLNSALFSGSFPVRSGIDNVYEIQLPKSINTDIFRLTLGPTTDSFHRYNVFVKVHISGMQGQAKWLPIR